MGALHDGHLSLVRTARAQADVVITSVFVNPTQFGLPKTWQVSPRRGKRFSHAGGGKCDYLFLPSVAEMYPGSNHVGERGSLSEKLDGRSRPGHFRGVTTVVAKLFNIVQPDFAFFGQKDAAQVAIINKMVHDLNLMCELSFVRSFAKPMDWL